MPMNEEIEIKVGIINPNEAERVLEHKTEFIKEKEQKDEYFVPINNDYFDEKPTKKYLRIRHDNKKYILAYHSCHYGDDGKLLKTDEYETEIENPDIMREILEKIGMKLKVTVKKHRKYYKYKNFEILLDKIEGLGWFIEVEAKVVNDSPEKIKEECYKLLEELNIKWVEAPNTGYPNMLLNNVRSNE